MGEAGEMPQIFEFSFISLDSTSFVMTYKHMELTKIRKLNFT